MLLNHVERVTNDHINHQSCQNAYKERLKSLSKNKHKYKNKHIFVAKFKFITMQDRTISRAGGTWEAGGALALPDLGRSVNPILTKDKLCPLHYH